MTTTRCEAVRDALPALARGALDAGDAAGVRAHLAGCAPCAAEWHAVSALAGAKGRAPAGLGDRVSAALARPHRRPLPRPIRWLGGAGVAAAAMIALILAWPNRPADDAGSVQVALADVTAADPFLDDELFDDGGALPLDVELDEALRDVEAADGLAAASAEDAAAPALAPIAMDLGDERGDWPGADGASAGAMMLDDLTYDELELLLSEMET